jgi:2-keto-3-deoxy-L-rhamnonate aldolase RhmA
VPLARFLYPPYKESVRQAIDEGFRILVVGGDVALLYEACREVVKNVRGR